MAEIFTQALASTSGMEAEWLFIEAGFAADERIVGPGLWAMVAGWLGFGRVDQGVEPQGRDGHPWL